MQSKGEIGVSFKVRRDICVVFDVLLYLNCEEEEGAALNIS